MLAKALRRWPGALMRRAIRRQTLEAVGIPLASVFAALLVTGLLCRIAGVNPGAAFAAIVEGAAGNVYLFGVTLNRAATLALAGLAIALAFRAGIFNVGAEGQLQMGAVAATAVAVHLTGPGWITISVALAAAMVAGALWAGIAAWLRTALGANEIVTTLMLNYVALLTIGYLITAPLAAADATFRQSERILDLAELPLLWPGTPVHAGVLLAFAAAAATWFFLQRTTPGFAIRVIGQNSRPANLLGWPVGRMVILGMLLAGALAGLAGAGEILGVHHRLLDGFSPGYGYFAIGVSFLARHQPFAILPVAFFVAASITGGGYLQRTLQVPSSVMFVCEGLLVMFMAAGTAIVQNRGGHGEPAVAPPTDDSTGGKPPAQDT